MVAERLALPRQERTLGKTPPWNWDRKSRLSALNGPSRELMPTMAFRLGLALRRCGDVDEADAFFSWSRRLMADRYVADRIAARHRIMRLEASGVEAALQQNEAMN